MRTSMTYPIRFWAFLLVCLLIFQFGTEAIADRYQVEHNIDVTLDSYDADKSAIAAIEMQEKFVLGISDSNGPTGRTSSIASPGSSSPNL